MNEKFRAHIEAMDPSFNTLLAVRPVCGAALPHEIPDRGIYLFSEGERHLYVGRSNRIRKRLQDHCRPSSGHNSATFAFRIARKETGMLAATYSTEGSRAELERTPAFAKAFADAKARVRAMDIRYVEEVDPMRQAILEMYVALSLETPFNDFDNH
jgi:predicted GIY-YIG superfamily endonuclease